MSVKSTQRAGNLSGRTIGIQSELYLQVVLDNRDTDSVSVLEELGWLRNRVVETTAGFIDEVELTDDDIAAGCNQSFVISNLHYTDLIKLAEFISLVGLTTSGVATLILKSD